MKTFKFNVCWNGSDVRMKISEGQRIVLDRCDDTDEGYESECQEYYYDGVLVCHHYVSGRDCDGPYSRDRSYEATELNEYGYPIWKLTESENRDYYAEAMGY